MNYNYFIDISSIYFIVLVLGCFLKTSIESVIDWFNMNKGNVYGKLQKLHKINPLMKKHFPYNKVKKIEKYRREHSDFDNMVSLIFHGISTIVLISGLVPYALHAVIQAFPDLGTTWHYVIFSILGILSGTLISAPVSYYSNFKIEAKYGFNKMTRKLFCTDIVKSSFLGIILGAVMIYVINKALGYGPFDALDILYFCIGLVLIGSVMEFLGSTVFLRLFNKLTPLNKKSLRKRIKKLMSQYGYSSNMVYVMDASKRSTKSNAFIGGIFGSKKIVLFDTLLKNFTDDEIIAVLGHELAHGKLHHLMFNRIISYGTLLATMYLIFYFAYDVELYHAFGFRWVNQANIVEYSFIGVILMRYMVSSVIWILNPIWAYLSRKFEYAADRYSVIYTKNRKALISALIKLSSENMSDIMPDPVYERYHYSHPSLANRIAAINRKEK
jgi:STE24 endopeptidase